MSYLTLEVDRWFLWWPVGMGLGIIAYFHLPFEPSAILVGAIFSVILLCTFFAWRKLSTTPLFQETSLRFFLYAMLSLTIGFALGKFRTEFLSTPHLSKALENVVLEGTIQEIEHTYSKNKDKRRVILNDLRFNDSFTVLPRVVRLSAGDELEGIQPGDRIECVVDLIPLPDPVSLQGYDLQQQLYFAGIGALGKIKGSCKMVHKAVPTMLSQWRYQLTQRLRAEIPGVAGEIAAALVTGDRSGIPKNVRQNFTDAGIAHILAISGLHVTLVAGLVFLIVRRGLAFVPYFAERFMIKKWAAFLVIIATAFYLAISGFGFPAQRAFMMTSLIMLGIFLDRNPLSMCSLAIAATVILSLFPESILSVSFQLSFAAVVSLIAAYENGWNPLREWMTGKYCRRFVGYTFGIISTTVVATIATTPYVIYTFNRFTLQALLGNLLAIPLTSLWIMPLAVASVASLAVGSTDSAFYLWGEGIKLLILIAENVAALPGAVFHIATPHPVFLWGVTIGGLWLCLWQKGWRWYGLMPIAFGAAFLGYDHHPNIYVAGNGSIIAYRDGDALHVSSKNREGFYAEIWGKEIGSTQIKSWPNQIAYYPVENPFITLLADPYRQENGERRGYLKTKEFIERHCAANSYLISNGYVWKACHSLMAPTQIIDRYQLTRKGTHFIWVWGEELKVVSMAEYLGERPWRIKNKKAFSFSSRRSAF